MERELDDQNKYAQEFLRTHLYEQEAEEKRRTFEGRRAIREYQMRQVVSHSYTRPITHTHIDYMAIIPPN